MKAYVIKIENDEIVSEIEWTGPLSWRALERFERGILTNMDRDRFRLDTNEISAVIRAGVPVQKASE